MTAPVKAENPAATLEPSLLGEQTSVLDATTGFNVIVSETAGKDPFAERKPAGGTQRTARGIWTLIRRRRDLKASLGPPPRLISSLRQMQLANRAPPPPEDIDHWAFMSCQLSRADADAHRIVYVGELTPRCGVAEFLSGAITWAEANPEVLVEIMWLGEGDLLGVLQAQPTPASLRQTFAPSPPCDTLPALFARCGLFVMPNLTGLRFCWITEAMAAGLPVLGSVRDIHVRALVVQNENGWLFDPLREREMSAALHAALTATPAQLDEKRGAARSRIRAMLNETRDERGICASAFPRW